jgi:hypothetical protein
MTLLSLVFTIFMPFLGSHTHASGIIQHNKSQAASRSVEPSVIENGTDVVTLPLANPVASQSKIGFTPDGSAYFINDFQSNALFRVTPAGSLTTFADLHARGYTVLYAQGNLWTTGDEGIVKIKPDGSGHHWYELNMGTSKGYSQGIVSGNDGAVYTVIQYVSSYGYTSSNYLYRIDASGNTTSVRIPIASVTGIVSGANGDFYMSYDDTYGTSGKEGVMRFRFDGTVVLFPIFAENYIPTLAFANGSLYFVSELRYNATYLDQIAPGDVVKRNSFPGLYWFPGNLAVDFGGNLWTTNDDPQNQYTGYSLYQYDTYTNKFTGPYEPSIIDNISSGFVNVGPDDNIWYLENEGQYTGSYANVTGVGVFVRKVQTLEPSATSASAVSFSILEAHYDGPWTAQSLSPSIATVLPAVSATGTFTAIAAGHGSAQIRVSDRLGNISYETVNVQ